MYILAKVPDVARGIKKYWKKMSNFFNQYITHGFRQL